MAKSEGARPVEPLFADPDAVGVHVVDQVTMHGLTGNLLDLTCCEIRKTPLRDGTVEAQAIVVARLRFDIGLAGAIRDLLDKHVALASGERGRSIVGPDFVKAVVN